MFYCIACTKNHKNREGGQEHPHLKEFNGGRAQRPVPKAILNKLPKFKYVPNPDAKWLERELRSQQEERRQLEIENAARKEAREQNANRPE